MLTKSIENADGRRSNADKGGKGHACVTWLRFRSPRTFLGGLSAFIGVGSAAIGVFTAFCLTAATAAESPTDDPFRYLEDATTRGRRSSSRSRARRRAPSSMRYRGARRWLARIRALYDAGITVSAIALDAQPRLLPEEVAGAGAGGVVHAAEGFPGAERVILDPARLARGGRAASIEWFAPSPDGRHVAYGVCARRQRGDGAARARGRLDARPAGRDRPRALQSRRRVASRLPVRSTTRATPRRGAHGASPTCASIATSSGATPRRTRSSSRPASAARATCPSSTARRCTCRRSRATPTPSCATACSASSRCT